MKQSLPRVIPPAILPTENSPIAAPPPASAAAPVAPAATEPSASALPPCAPPSTTPHTASRALLLQTAEIPAEAARLVRCHNPWPTEDVLFCLEDALLAFVSGIPALSSGPAAGAHHRDTWTSASTTLPATEPGCATEGDGASPANAGQRHHPPLQQFVGFAGGDGEKKDGSLIFVSIFDNLTQLPSRTCTHCPG